MQVTDAEVTGLLNSVKNYKTIREGSSAFRIASAKDPTLDKRSFGAGYEEGIYYAIVAGVIEDITSFQTNGIVVWNKL